jgi:hypothetical protein
VWFFYTAGPGLPKKGKKIEEKLKDNKNKSTSLATILIARNV